MPMRAPAGEDSEGPPRTESFLSRTKLKRTTSSIDRTHTTRHGCQTPSHGASTGSASATKGGHAGHYCNKVARKRGGPGGW
jgi:hypothetical protein